jgi:hypothetical protein
VLCELQSVTAAATYGGLLEAARPYLLLALCNLRVRTPATAHDFSPPFLHFHPFFGLAIVTSCNGWLPVLCELQIDFMYWLAPCALGGSEALSVVALLALCNLLVTR